MLTFVHLNPIKALFWAAIVNGVVAGSVNGCDHVDDIQSQGDGEIHIVLGFDAVWVDCNCDRVRGLDWIADNLARSVCEAGQRRGYCEPLVPKVRRSMYCSGICARVPFFHEVFAQGLGEEESVIRILVVDDNPSVRRYLRGLLEQHDGWRVCDEARNGREAVERFQQIRPDIVVLDFQMPEMNGLDAARIITQLSPETPILMVTLYLSKQLSDEARQAGIRGTCAKTDVSAVVDAVGALLREETFFPG